MKPIRRVEMAREEKKVMVSRGLHLLFLDGSSHVSERREETYGIQGFAFTISGRFASRERI